MRDSGIPKGLIINFDTSSRLHRGEKNAIYGWRKHFWNYLGKVNVPFYDPCCADANTANIFPVRFNAATGGLERYNGSAWIAADDTVVSLQTGLTALAAGGQTGATALTAGYNEITVSATVGDSVVLPAAAIGLVVTVKNDGTTAADVFPALADTINDGGANTAVRIAVGSTIIFTAITATNWETNNQVLSSDTISEQTSTAGVTVDGVLLKDGGVSANSMFAGFFPTTAAQALSGAGAVNVTSYLTKYTSTGGAQALSIAAGSQIGQRKKVLHVVDGGSGILTGTFVGGTTITFTSVGEFADLMWTGAAWAVLELGNTEAIATPPALA